MNSLMGIKMTPIPADKLGYLGKMEEFYKNLCEQSKNLKEPHVAIIEGQIYIFEGHFPEIPDVTKLDGFKNLRGHHD